MLVAYIGWIISTLGGGWSRVSWRVVRNSPIGIHKARGECPRVVPSGVLSVCAKRRPCPCPLEYLASPVPDWPGWPDWPGYVIHLGRLRQIARLVFANRFPINWFLFKPSIFFSNSISQFVQENTQITLDCQIGNHRQLPIW